MNYQDQQAMDGSRALVEKTQGVEGAPHVSLMPTRRPWRVDCSRCQTLTQLGRVPDDSVTGVMFCDEHARMVSAHDALVAALKQFGKHSEGCRWWRTNLDNACTCGLHAALREG